MKILSTLLSTLLFTFLAFGALGQSQHLSDIQNYIQNTENDFQKADLQNLVVTNSFISAQNGATFVYASQSVNGIRIANSSLTAVFDKSGKLRNVSEHFFTHINERANGSNPGIALSDAVLAQLSSEIAGIKVVYHPGAIKNLTISGQTFSHTTKAELVYYALPEGKINLAWTFDCPLPNGKHWYHSYVDAHSGDLLKAIDWQVDCGVEGVARVQSINASNAGAVVLLSPNDGSGYNVFEFPVESPNHGNRSIAVEPGNGVASPFGWHDTNGTDGAEYTITRGNNVYAYADVNDQDFPGFSPDGGANLSFDYPYDSSMDPATYQSAAITNLFYANNRIHDILFQYGFDEASGNFQATNYSGVGESDDYVIAEAQDGGGTNNANFATPPDGFNPRMQMYLWFTGTFSGLFEVNSPSNLSGTYLSSGAAAFGPALPSEGITANLGLADDGVNPDVNDACQPIQNDLTGKIAILNRGDCTFVEKVIAAQEAGAVACIIVNNDGDNVIAMGGSDFSITIPSVMIGLTDGQNFISAIENGNTVNVTLHGNIQNNTQDASFDNGIITHEYCHGVSIRLTGGSANSDCLNNEEQMGEGWSDWYSMMLTMDMNAENPVHRPIGTFASGQAINSVGIRPVPYDTNMVVNPYTYADLGNNEISVPHGVGFIWSTMLWDLTWAFIDEYGYDSDIDNGNGGNNKILQLITDALKIQVCQPGFVDGRDAILIADELNNDGANKCMIWRVFARRGLGYSASQGSSQSRSDGDAAFDIPPTCLTSIEPPIAAFSSDVSQTCTGNVQFTDESTNIPQLWHWDFGDGTTSTDQNPMHTYLEEGVYTVSLQVTNELGEDSATQTDLISFSLPSEPEVSDASGCIGNVLTLTATSDGLIQWLNSDGQFVGEGNTFTIEVGEASETYFAQTVVQQAPAVHVGPQNTSFGPGENHNTNFIGTVDFTTYQPLTIQTADVVSGGVGQRTILLWAGPGGVGTPIDQRVVNIDFTGAGTIDLGFEIDQAGEYSIGLNQANLYRNEGGTDYPYEIPGLISLTGSSAGPDYYYYFYNLKVAPIPCVSLPVEVTVESLGSAQFSSDANDVSLTVHFTSEAIGATSWSWSFGDGESASEENPTHVYAQSGSYTVSLETNTGCIHVEDILVGTTSIESLAKQGYAIDPNPATDYIQVRTDAQTTRAAQIVFYDLQGRIIQENRLNGTSSESIYVGELPAGVYLIAIRDKANKSLYRQRLLLLN